MRVRIGRDDFGDPITVDTSGVARIGLCGPPGSGKTTTCRYLARRWSAGAGNTPCAVVTTRVYEYRDLADSHLVTVAATIAGAPQAVSRSSTKPTPPTRVSSSARSARRAQSS